MYSAVPNALCSAAHNTEYSAVCVLLCLVLSGAISCVMRKAVYNVVSSTACGTGCSAVYSAVSSTACGTGCSAVYSAVCLVPRVVQVVVLCIVLCPVQSLVYWFA